LVTNVQHPDRHLLDFFPQLKRRVDVAILAGGRELPPKPAPEPFLRCLDDLGVDPDEAVYVGDDWHIDIQGARAVGLRVIWLQHALIQRSFPQTETAIPIIKGLEPLLDLESLLRS
jgi:putative hydrolase of the HAD superfamily